MITTNMTTVQVMTRMMMTICRIGILIRRIGMITSTLITGIGKSKRGKSASTTGKTPERALLLLDFDTRESYRAAPERLRFLARWFDVPFASCRVRRFRTRRGWHMVVYYRGVKRFTAAQIVAAQAIAGSDWRRETFNLVRARHLTSAPKSWRRVGVWNTLYAEKFAWSAERSTPEHAQN